jgi:hypothetical protein
MNDDSHPPTLGDLDAQMGRLLDMQHGDTSQERTQQALAKNSRNTSGAKVFDTYKISHPCFL